MSQIKPLIEISTTVNIDEGWVAIVSKTAQDNQALLSSICMLVVVYIFYLIVKVVVDGFKLTVQALAQLVDGKRYK
jgi:hypothetical protein